MGMSKIIGDLLGGFAIKIACAVGSCVVASQVYDVVKHAFDPVNKALGG